MEKVLYLQWYLGLIDHIKTRIFVKKEYTPEQYKTTNKVNIFFRHKGVEIISISKILRSKNVLSKMHSEMSKDDIPMVTYELQKPVSFKLFNNKKFVESSYQLLYPK